MATVALITLPTAAAATTAAAVATVIERVLQSWKRFCLTRCIVSRPVH